MLSIFAVLSFYYAQLQAQNYSPDVIKDYIVVESLIAGVPTETSLHIAENESGFNPQAVGDHNTSFGVWQIHNPESKGLTRAQAEDVVFSTQWSIQQLKAGNCKIWSTCNDGS